jgi:pimeloyl-ACP methyl ester carboxylesterase
MTGTIYMIHGMWGGPWVWDHYRPVFEAAGYRCIAATLPYHDMAPRGPPHPRLGNTSLLDYADALEREIGQMDEVPVIMGHSMGGLLAQMLGARVRPPALVLLAPASPAGLFALTPSVLRGFLSVQAKWGFWKKPMRQTFNEAVYSTLHLLPDGEQRTAYERLVYESGRAAAEIGYWFLDPKKASRVDADRVSCPVLVVAGGRDRITPPAVARRLARRYGASATFRLFEEHAHWIMAEPGWQDVAAYVEGWLRAQRGANLPTAVDR